MLKGFCTLSLFGLVLSLSACQSIPSDTAPSVISASNLLKLRQNSWILKAIGANAVPAQPVAYLQFTDDFRVYGTDSCNRLIANYQAGPDTLSLQHMVSTQMACLKQPAIDLPFNQALQKVSHYQIYQNHLKLLDRYGNVLLHFKATAKIKI